MRVGKKGAETIGNTFVNNRMQNNAGLLLTRDITSIEMLCVCVRERLGDNCELCTVVRMGAISYCTLVCGRRGGGIEKRVPGKECNECHTCDTNLFYFNNAFAWVA